MQSPQGAPQWLASAAAVPPAYWQRQSSPALCDCHCEEHPLCAGHTAHPASQRRTSTQMPCSRRKVAAACRCLLAPGPPLNCSRWSSTRTICAGMHSLWRPSPPLGGSRSSLGQQQDVPVAPRQPLLLRASRAGHPAGCKEPCARLIAAGEALPGLQGGQPDVGLLHTLGPAQARQAPGAPADLARVVPRTCAHGCACCRAHPVRVVVPGSLCSPDIGQAAGQHSTAGGDLPMTLTALPCRRDEHRPPVQSAPEPAVLRAQLPCWDGGSDWLAGRSRASSALPCCLAPPACWPAQTRSGQLEGCGSSDILLVQMLSAAAIRRGTGARDVQRAPDGLAQQD